MIDCASAQERSTGKDSFGWMGASDWKETTNGQPFGRLGWSQVRRHVPLQIATGPSAFI